MNSSSDSNPTPQEVIDHIQRAADHLKLADDVLEEQGCGLSYIGEEHMTEALVAIRDLSQARVEAKEAEENAR